MADGRPITFLSDYGYADEFAGVCRAVISQIAPDAPVIDLTHGIAPQGIRHGALSLERALPFCAPGVHLAVVDPGVGTDRRAVVVAVAEDRYLVGPDNGLLWPAIVRLGGPVEAVDLARSPFRLEPVSTTFAGRDLFAPVAAHLSIGATLAEAGKAIDPAGLERLVLPEPIIEDDRVIAHVIDIDGYGNAALDLGPTTAGFGPLHPADRVEIRTGAGLFEGHWARTFAEVGLGELLLYEDSSGGLALAVNGGNAAAQLDLAPDCQVILSFR